MAIDWQSVLITTFVTTGGSATILLTVAWLLKSALAEWLTRETKEFETRLKADAEIEIERLKSALQMAATEHQVRFSKMHEKRAKVIENLYKMLTDVYWEGQHFVMTSENSPMDYQKKKFASVEPKLLETFWFLEHNRIFLPKDLCAMLYRHFEQVNKAVYAARSFGRIENPNDHVAQQSVDAFTKMYKDFETEIPTARSSLEAEFRKMLGVDSSAAKE